MKIVILTKRAPQKKDLWNRPNGRFYHLAKGLADAGHDVHLILLSYSRKAEFREARDGISWYSVNLLPDPFRYYRFTRSLVSTVRADWVFGFSDTYFGICADMVAQNGGVNSLIDAYDNYESYLSWFVPLHWLWRRSLRRSTAVTAAGPNLLSRMVAGRINGNAEVIEMASDPKFLPGSQHRARESLGLPLDRRLVTYCGSLYRNRGIEELFEVIRRLDQSSPDVLWVLSGRLEKGVNLPKNCLYLGYVDDDKVVDVIRSADLVLCVNKPGRFGDYSYPVKVYEALSIGVPVVAFRTTSIEFVMRNNLDGLVVFGDLDGMVEKIRNNLSSPYSVKPNAAGWSEQCTRLNRCLLSWGRERKETF